TRTWPALGPRRLGAIVVMVPDGESSTGFAEGSSAVISSLFREEDDQEYLTKWTITLELQHDRQEGQSWCTSRHPRCKSTARRGDQPPAGAADETTKAFRRRQSHTLITREWRSRRIAARL